MNLFMLDVDGTLIDSHDYDAYCFRKSISQVMNIELNDLSIYNSSTDIGIIEALIEKHGLRDKRMSIIRDVKNLFISKLASYISSNKNQLVAKPGAIQFMQDMKTHPNVVVAIATGGFEEAAKMKLKAAGFDYHGISFASCSDAMTRGEIMALAAFRAKQDHGVIFNRRVYFGDGEWDKMATNSLGYEFVAVGNNVTHHTKINNFSHYAAIFGKLGLTQILN